MFAARRFASAAPVLIRHRVAAGFHSSAPAFVKVGDKIPDVELMEGSPGNKVSIAEELKGKGLIIGRFMLSAKKDISSLQTTLYTFDAMQLPDLESCLDCFQAFLRPIALLAQTLISLATSTVPNSRMPVRSSWFL